jgi:hypothetical protein
MPKLRNSGGSAAAQITEAIHDALTPPTPPAKRPLTGHTPKDVERYHSLLRAVEETLAARDAHEYAKLCRAHEQAREEFRQVIGSADVPAFVEDAKRCQLRAELPSDVTVARDACRKAIGEKQRAFSNANFPSVDVVRDERGRLHAEAQQRKVEELQTYRVEIIRVLGAVGCQLDDVLDADPAEARVYFRALRKWVIALDPNRNEGMEDE